METQEKVNKIIKLIEKFMYDIDPYGIPSKFLKPKKEISFTRKELEKLIDEIIKYYGINENDLEILDDEVAFIIPSDRNQFETEDGVYGITVEARLKFKKENGSLKLTRIEMVKSIDQIY